MRANEGQAAGERAPEERLAEPERSGREPFGETANPGAYVPREATEDALLELERLVRAGRTTAITAPPGLGKSLLLRLLERRLAPGFCCLFLPYAALTLDELCAWTLGLLGSEPLEEPKTELLREVRSRGDGELLVLLIDDAGSMPLETARGLGRLILESGNRIRVVVGAADDAASSRVLAALHTEIAEIRFAEPMTALETRLYVQTRLEQAGVEASLRARFDEEALGTIHRLSGGVPRRIHDLAGSLLDKAPAGVGRAWKEERWLGAPMDETPGEPLEDEDLAVEADDDTSGNEMPD